MRTKCAYFYCCGARSLQSFKLE